MDFDTFIAFVQSHFSDGLALVIGSGLSAAEGMAGMGPLAAHLSAGSKVLKGDDAKLWSQIQTQLDAGDGLEASLLKHQPTPTLEDFIVRSTCSLLVPQEQTVIGQVISGKRELRLSLLLSRLLKPAAGLPILTTNYDRLIEVACELAGFHVDTTAIGIYAGAFDHSQSCMGSCRGIITRGKTKLLSHFPRAVVLKPHGSFDWYRFGGEARRCSVEIDAERLIITPGLNKYRAGYDSPFDKHREMANAFIDAAARLVIVGYGFNDDHLQTHLLKRIRGGVPTLILNRSASTTVVELARSAPQCVLVSKPNSFAGVSVVSGSASFDRAGADLWDIGILTKEVLL